MKLIVGLGNPGVEYQFTWHNLGFLALDQLAGDSGITISSRRCRALTGKGTIGGLEVLLAKPQTYMNLSGLAVRALVEELDADPAHDLVVVHDELDLPLGCIRVRKRGGAAGNHGVESIIGALGTQEFVRVRLGIASGKKVEDGARYVLSPIPKSKYKTVSDLVDTAGEAVKAILADGPDVAMNHFNRRAGRDAHTGTSPKDEIGGESKTNRGIA